MEAYDSKTASRIAGVSLRQIQYWDERGFIRPSVKLAHGRGTKRLYSFHDLVCLKVMKDLTRRGLSLQKVRRCLLPLRRYTAAGAQTSDSLKYLTDGERMFIITSDRDKILEAVNRQFVLSLAIGTLVRDLNSRLKRAENRTLAKGMTALPQYIDKRSGAA